MKNNQKGITLVALVITIIVLLILAGVTLAALSGENGILVRGRESKYATNIATAKELVLLGIHECITDYYADKYVADSSNLITDGSTIADYIAANLKSTQAGDVVASVTETKITTNVTDIEGTTLEATMATDGKITGWTGDVTSDAE